MAVVVVADNGVIDSDPRFKRWGKVVTSVDLTKRGGYAIEGDFVKWGTSLALEPGQFLVLASETGSRANHSYTYGVVYVDKNGEVRAVDWHTFETEVKSLPLTDQQRANANNSDFYKLAVWIANKMQAPDPLLQARQELTKLPVEQRLALFAEFQEKE